MLQRQVMATMVCGSLLTISSYGRAEANACAAAYEQAQELRADGLLRQARRALESCVQPACSEFVRSECGRWLSEVEASMPSVVLVAKKGGKETEVVRVLYDDETLTESLDGKAVPVDPGQHTLKFLADGAKPINVKIVIREGEKNRQITVELAEEPRPAERGGSERSPTAVPAPTRGTSFVPYALGGVGLLGVAGFVALGLMGNQQLAHRERTCAPTCSDAEVGSVRTKYYLADLSLGIGAISLGVATYLLLASSPNATAPVAEQGKTALDVRLTQGGGLAELRTRF